MLSLAQDRARARGLPPARGRCRRQRVLLRARRGGGLVARRRRSRARAEWPGRGRCPAGRAGRPRSQRCSAARRFTPDRPPHARHRRVLQSAEEREPPLGVRRSCRRRRQDAGPSGRGGPRRGRRGRDVLPGVRRGSRAPGPRRTGSGGDERVRRRCLPPAHVTGGRSASPHARPDRERVPGHRRPVGRAGRPADLRPREGDWLPV